jgi:hypothetical protein
MRRALLIGLVGLLALTAGCSGSSTDAQPTESTDTPAEVEAGDGIERFVDEEAGVVCYVSDKEGATASGAGWKSGISCVPLNETDLN